jgi:hypothetical protein
MVHGKGSWQEDWNTDNAKCSKLKLKSIARMKLSMFVLDLVSSRLLVHALVFLESWTTGISGLLPG